LKGSTTQKNLGAKSDININAIIEMKKYSQYLPVDFVVSISFEVSAKLRG